MTSSGYPDPSRTHLRRLSRVYSPETWDVYALLDRPLETRGPDWLHTKASRYLTPNATILDAGCRDGAHLVRLVRDNDVTGVGVEPVATHVDRARRAVGEAGLDEAITIVSGTVEELDRPPGSFDVVWCRDVLEQVSELVPFLAAAARLSARDGRMLVYTTVTTDLLEPGERELLRQHMGNVADNLAESTLTAAFAEAGWEIDERDVIGTEWREYAEERTRPASTALLRLARLRRQRDRITAEHGDDIYRHVEANLHWEVFGFLGKLRPLVYVLRLRR